MNKTKHKTGIFLLFIVFALPFLAESVGAQSRPWGRMIDIGNSKLHLHCTGKGESMVLLGAGSGGWSIYFYELQKRLESKMRVCSYDRAGFGWSSKAQLPRTARKDAEDLKKLIEASGESGKFVFLAASYSGYVARIYNELYPGDLKGILFVDSGHEDQWVRIPIAKRLLDDSLHALEKTFSSTQTGEFDRSVFRGRYSKKILPLYQESMMRMETQEVYISTLKSINKSADQLRATGSMKGLPIVVLSAGNSFAEFIPDTKENKELLKSLNGKWMELQRDLAAKSENAEHVVVPNGTHDLVTVKPNVVIAALELLMAQLQTADSHVQIADRKGR